MATPASSIVDKGADFSECLRYRYTLWRTWDGVLPPVVFLALNPSTADALVDDPTIRRCVGSARTWGKGGVVVVNLFAWRATDPRELLINADKAVGPENDSWIREACAGRQVVAAWGATPWAKWRARKVLKMLRKEGHAPLCLGTTQGGRPRHPLFVKADTPLVPYLERS